MPILSITTDTAGQIGVNPRTIKIVTTDSFSVITTAGYLNTTNSQGYLIEPTDTLDIIYSFVQTTNTGTYGKFLPSFSNGVITLEAYVDAGNVTLPVVSGHFANFDGTTGLIQDAGYLPSNAAKTNVVMASGATTVNSIPIFTDTAGTIGVNTGSAVVGGPVLPGATGGMIGTAFISLNPAAVIAMYANPVQLVAASNTNAIYITSLQVNYIAGSSAFTGGGILVVQYGNAAHGAGTSATNGASIAGAGLLTGGTTNEYVAVGGFNNSATGTGNSSNVIIDTGIYISNQSAPFAVGTGATLTVCINYVIVPTQ